MTDPTARDLIQRLADALEGEIEHKVGWGEPDYDGELINEARAYLAQPVPDGLTDEELLSLAASVIDPYSSSGIKPGEYETETECAIEVYGTELVAFARAALERYGNRTPAPDGPTEPDGREPASAACEPSDEDLQFCMPQRVRMTLSSIAQSSAKDGSRYWDAVRKIESSLVFASCDHARAALARYGGRTPAPIPLSERQPAEADCDKEGRCWAWNQGNCFWWEIINSDLISFSHDAYTHWLPYWALPVPGVEA